MVSFKPVVDNAFCVENNNKLLQVIQAIHNEPGYFCVLSVQFIAFKVSRIRNARHAVVGSRVKFSVIHRGCWKIGKVSLKFQ